MAQYIIPRILATDLQRRGPRHELVSLHLQVYIAPPPGSAPGTAPMLAPVMAPSAAPSMPGAFGAPAMPGAFGLPPLVAPGHGVLAAAGRRLLDTWSEWSEQF